MFFLLVVIAGLGACGGEKATEPAPEAPPGIELTSFPVEARMGHQVTLEARSRGAIIRPLGDVVVLMPPLAISEAELRRLVGIIAEAIDAATATTELAAAA